MEKLTVDAYLKLAIHRLAEEGRPEVGEKQSDYMRNHFPFYGVKAPQQKIIFSDLFKQYGVFSEKELKAFARKCFEEEYRELHYLELDDSKEFFIQKTAGWALRDHSKIKPDSVKLFLKNNPQLAPLTKREASKYL